MSDRDYEGEVVLIHNRDKKVQSPESGEF